MSLSEIKHTLRKYEFPQSAQEALVKIEQLLSGRTAPSSKQMDIVMELISEFVFCEADRRSGRRGSGLNSLQELQLIDIVCNYLSGSITETMKNTIFLSLFSGADSQKRMKILCILASMAVSASNTPMLLAVAVWLQQTGSTSPQSLQLVESIIKDHFYLNTSNQIVLRSLATSAPQFVANFITTITELYMHGDSIKMPPKNLLEVITSWVFSNPSLCMSAQLNPAALPNGAIPMGAVTPLAGLIHWCSLAPLYVDEDAEMNDNTDCIIEPKRIKLEGDKDHAINKIKSHILSESELYIKLHLGVLHSLRVGKRTHGPATAVNAQNLVMLVNCIQKYIAGLQSKGVRISSDGRLQDCLDRMGQAIQVSLTNGCIYGNINSLLAVLHTLPDNRLLKIIAKNQQRNI